MPRTSSHDLCSPERARGNLLFLALSGLFYWADVLLSGATHLFYWAMGWLTVSVVQDARPSVGAWAQLGEALLSLAVIVGGLMAGYALVNRLFNAAKKSGKAPPFRLLGGLTRLVRRKPRSPSVGG